MNSLVYLMRKSFKNGFIKILKKPTALIGYCLIFGLMFFNMYKTFGSMEASGDTEMGVLIFLGILLLLTVFSILLPIYQSANKFSLAFLPADGIYLMNGPFSPKKLLYYAQIKQGALMLSFIVLVGLQVPILRNGVGLEVLDIVVFFIIYCLMTFTSNIFGLLTFSICLDSELNKRIIKILTIVTLIVILGITVYFILNGEDLLVGVYEGLSSWLWLFVPIIGWIQLIMVSLTSHVYGVLFFVPLALIIISNIVAIVTISSIVDDSYYEEALNTANQIKEVKQGLKEGKNAFQASSFNKKQKVRKTKYRFKRSGIMVMFDKYLLISQKKGLQFLNSVSLLYVAMIVGGGWLAQIDSEGMPFGLVIGTGITTYIMLIFHMAGGFQSDLGSHYIYMMPYNSLVKLFTLLIGDMIKVAIDVTIGISIACIVFGYGISDGLMCILVLLSYNYIFSCSGILGLVLFGKTGTTILRLYFKIIINILIILPGIIAVVLFALLNFESMNVDAIIRIGLGILLLINIVLGIGLSFPASFVVNKPEYSS